jgi:hypothetical protein
LSRFKDYVNLRMLPIANPRHEGAHADDIGAPRAGTAEGRRLGGTGPVGRTRFKGRRDRAIQYFAVMGAPQIQIAWIRGPSQDHTC